jgi:hypothetical protein
LSRTATSAVVLVVFAAGCGGSGGGGERLSRDAYIAKADAICRGVDAQRKKIPVPAAIPDIPAYVDRALPILDSAVSELRALQPPAALDEQVSAWLSAIGDERGALSDLRGAAAKNDVAKVRAIGSTSTGVAARARTQARAIGLVDCANS